MIKDAIAVNIHGYGRLAVGHRVTGKTVRHYYFMYYFM